MPSSSQVMTRLGMICNNDTANTNYRIRFLAEYSMIQQLIYVKIIEETGV